MSKSETVSEGDLCLLVIGSVFCVGIYLTPVPPSDFDAWSKQIGERLHRIEELEQGRCRVPIYVSESKSGNSHSPSDSFDASSTKPAASCAH